MQRLNANSDLPRGGPRVKARSRGDLWLVIGITVVTYVVASILELQELLTHRLMSLERWQVDELPLTLTVLAAGLTWYAFRRRHEAEASLALRAQAEARVVELLGRNRELARRLISVQESEKVALARELHDEFGQRCSAIRAETAYMRHCVGDADDSGDTRNDDRARMLASAARADAAALALYQLVRDMLRRLRPADLDSLGLSAALQALATSWSERTGVACQVACHGVDDSVFEGMSDAANIAVYRVTQEALTNVARHARATRVKVVLSLLRADAPSRDRQLCLSIEDDGIGMNSNVVAQGLGLLGAVERAAAVGGDLEIVGRRREGVRLTMRIPLAPDSADAEESLGNAAYVGASVAASAVDVQQRQFA